MVSYIFPKGTHKIKKGTKVGDIVLAWDGTWLNYPSVYVVFNGYNKECFEYVSPDNWEI